MDVGEAITAACREQRMGDLLALVRETGVDGYGLILRCFHHRRRPYWTFTSAAGS